MNVSMEETVAENLFERRLGGLFQDLFGVVAGPMIELFAGGQSEGLKVVGCRHEINGGFMASSWGWQTLLLGSVSLDRLEERVRKMRDGG